MGHADIPKIEDLGAELSFWSSYRELRRAKGFDPDLVLKEWAAEQEKSLTSPGPREEFAELCKDGCLRQALALLVAMLRYSPMLETYWVEMVGNLDKRDKTARALEKAAKTLEGLFADIVASEKSGKNEVFSQVGLVPISSVISGLRFHVRFINFARSLSADTGTRSPAELSKYLLSSYVKRMTGRFHDKSVSCLIGEICGSQDYNEVAQRMWRLRNYRRLEKHFSWMTNILVAMSVVIAHAA
jgi:hypothetical protein